MKKILLAVIFLTVLIAVAGVFCSALPFEEGLNVLYISDDGTGDGSSPLSPLGNAEGYAGEDGNAYKNGALYRSFDLLSRKELTGAGAKIVLCGEVTIDNGHTGNAHVDRSSDFNLPEIRRGYTVTLTSVDPFDGTDYRLTKDAMLILDRTVCGVNIHVNADALFENLTILTKIDSSSSVGVSTYAGTIGGRCHSLTMGDGITCLAYDASIGANLPNDDSYYYAFPNLVGSSRYSNMTGDTHLTVKSGTWRAIYGADLGIDNASYGLLTGNTNVEIYGGDIFSGVFGTGRGSESRITGDVSIAIRGGVFYSPVCGCGQKGFLSGSKCRIEISGGDFSAISPSSPVVYAGNKNGTAPLADSSVLSFQNYTGDDFESLAARADGFDTVYGPGEEYVIFIRDGGTGDGSSASSPLAAESISSLADISSTPPTYMDTAIWQAFWKLRETGGTIVVCGEVNLHKDSVAGTATNSRNFVLPGHGKKIRITSVFGGVDYRTDGARLIVETPTQLLMGGETEWDDIEFVANGTGRILSCNGYKTVFKEGVTCSVYDASHASDANYYPSVIGGSRYKELETDTDLSVYGGTWNHICAGSYSINATNTTRNVPYGILMGDTHLIFGGNAVCKGAIFGTTNNSSATDALKIPYQTGNVSITICGGTVTKIYGAGNGRFANKNATVRLKITGIDPSVTKCTSYLSTGTLRYAPEYAVLDLSDFDGNPDVFTQDTKFTNVVPPTSKLISCSASVLPTKTSYAEGEPFVFDGMKVTAHYYGGASGTVRKSATFVYSPLIDGFSCGEEMTSTTKSVPIFYQGLPVTADGIGVTVADRSVPVILGAQVGTKDSGSESLRFIAKIKRNGIPVSSYGFLVLPEDDLAYPEELRFDCIGGAEVIEATGTELPAVYYDGVDRTGWMLFGGVLDEIDTEHFQTNYTAVAFIRYTVNGEEKISYSEPLTRSVYQVALAAGESDLEKQIARDWLKTNIVARTERGAKNPVSESRSMEMRQEIVSYMQSMAEVEWTPSVEIDYQNYLSYSTPVYKAGTKYYGLPYNSAYGNADAFSAQLVNGVLPSSANTDWYFLPGNTCSTSIIIAMNYSVNTITQDVGATNMLPVFRSDYLPVGDTVQPDWITTTALILEGYGSTDAERQQVLYESYAKMQPADIVVSRWFHPSNHSCLGHSRQVAAFPTVVRNPDGTIDPDASKVMLMEQTSSFENGSFLNPQPSTWKKYEHTFRSLGSGTVYVPVTTEVFSAGYPEKAVCVLRGFSTADTVSDGVEGLVKSNYNLEWVKITLEKDGTVIAEDDLFPALARTAILEDNTPNVNAKLNTTSGKMTVRVTARVKSETREIGLLTFEK